MSDERYASRARRVRTALAALIGQALVRVLGATWRVRLVGPDHLRAAEGHGPGVAIAIWHGELLPLVWAHRRRGIAAIISTHADGEVIARIVEALGFQPIRGSSSRGGMRALLEASRTLRAGQSVAFTTDGPRGPRRVSAPGIGVAAARANAPVVAIGCRVSRAWRLRSWDRFVIPKPFARVDVRYAPAVRAAGPDPAHGEAIVPAIDAALFAVCEPDAA
ncbi:MAG: lysophospholipid acyltransferase family protein [Gemmatimonadaceae bacterium]|nr:lysophospholipid acyltransferase family protein [Gemmatimonadaceae bacterium]